MKIASLGRSLLVVALSLAAAAVVPGAARADGRTSLNLPKLVFGHRANVGLLILGHSTSEQGDYPHKLAAALNANAADGRNYQVFPVTTGGDGGFLWTQAQFPPTDLQFNRVAASNVAQYCTDGTGHRWSVRRLKVDRALTGAADPTGGACPTSAPPSVSCTYYDAAGAKQAAGFRTCWQKMDLTLALIQDTTNRSWPIDDFTGDGQVNNLDFWPASKIADAAEPCTNGRSGVVNGSIDWTCDGVLNGADAAHGVYAGWLEKLALALLNNYGADGVDHVFVTSKPLEFGATCPNYPVAEQAQCTMHNTRTATASRPFNHFYNPLVYWEWRSVQTLVTKPTLDSRIHLGEFDLRRMHQRSAECYDVGLTGWTIPASVAGRPATEAADDTEPAGGQEVNAETVGCMRSDHVHHNDAGGWMMADVWYQGLVPYLS